MKSLVTYSAHFLFSVFALAPLLLIGCTDSGPCPEQSIPVTAGGDTPTAEPYLSRTDPFVPGELSVRVVDVSRCEDGAPYPLRIHSPKQAGTYPWVAFENGFMARNSAYDEILSHVASHGFVVIAPQLYEPGPSAFLGDPTAIQESERLQEILDWAPTHLQSMTGVSVRTDLLGLSGHSRGAKVAYILTTRDSSRITALAAVDPVDDGGGPLRNQPHVINGTFPFSLPTLIIGTGRKSDCAPVGENHVQFYAATKSPVWHVVALNQGHADMLDEDQAELAALICDSGPDRTGMRRLTAGLLTTFFRAALQGDTTAYAHLTDTASSPIPVSAESK